jgi:hypothetical protein
MNSEDNNIGESTLELSENEEENDIEDMNLDTDSQTNESEKTNSDSEINDESLDNEIEAYDEEENIDSETNISEPETELITSLKQKIIGPLENQTQLSQNKIDSNDSHKGLTDKDLKYLKSISAKPYETIKYNNNYSENFINPNYRNSNSYYSNSKHKNQLTLEDQICTIAESCDYDLNKLRQYINKLPVGIRINCKELNNRIPLPNDYKFRMANQKLLIAKLWNVDKTKSTSIQNNTQNTNITNETINEIKSSVQMLAYQLDAILELYKQEEPELHTKLLNIYNQILEQKKN